LSLQTVTSSQSLREVSYIDGVICYLFDNVPTGRKPE